jgi:hypothetical protein
MLNRQIRVLTRVKSYLKSGDVKPHSDHIYTCPSCVWGNLHHAGVRVDTASIPVGPYSQVQIEFWCEVCGQTHALMFSHHEGQTVFATHPVVAVGVCHGA